jgi:hypothetical protein
MGAILMRAASDLRAHRRAAIGMALLVALVAAVALTAAAGARRTGTAFRRMLVATRAHDVEIQLTGESRDPDALMQRLGKLDEVQDYARIAIVPVQVTRGVPASEPFQWSMNAGASIDGRASVTIDKARVLQGRSPDFSHPNEAAANASFMRANHLRVGDTVTVRTITLPELFEVFGGRPVVPTGPKITLRLVGVWRLPHDVQMEADEQSGNSTLYVTPAFYRAYRDRVAVLDIAWARLHRGQADVASFIRKARALEVSPEGEMFSFETKERLLDAAQRALDVQAGALWLFAAMSAAAGLVLAGQTLSRFVYTAGDEAATMSALGMSRAQRMLALALVPAGAVVAGGVLGVAGAYAASWSMPIGFARALEPQRGIAADVLVLGAGGAAFVVALLVRALASGWLASSARAGVAADEATVSRVADASARAGLPPSAVAGVRLALRSGRGIGAVSVHSAIVGAIAGTLAVASALTFATSFDHMLRSPRSSGWTWDGDTAGGEDPDVLQVNKQRLLAEPDLAAFARLDVRSIPAGRRELKVFGFDQIRGSIEPLVVEGRPPASSDEIVLGPVTMRETHARLGARITLPVHGCSNAAACNAEFRVVGKAILPPIDGNPTGRGAALTRAGAERLAGTAGYTDYIVRFRPGVDAAAAREHLRREYNGFNNAVHSEDVLNLERVRGVPLVLAGLVLGLALATLAHAAVTSVRRRRRDLAILKTLGFNRRQIASTVAFQATTFAVVGLLVGIPLGVAGGRWGWRVVIDRVGVDGPPALPVATLALACALALVVANAVVAFPARSASRTRAAEVLRAE